MSFAARSLVVAALVGARAAQAQTPATPQPAPAQQAQPAPPSVVAGIPVNYDESKVGTYTLPDPLVTNICFGGPDLRTAYVTTAWKGMTPGERAAQPLAGDLFSFAAPAPGLRPVEVHTVSTP